MAFSSNSEKKTLMQTKSLLLPKDLNSKQGSRLCFIFRMSKAFLGNGLLGSLTILRTFHGEPQRRPKHRHEPQKCRAGSSCGRAQLALLGARPNPFQKPGFVPERGAARAGAAEIALSTEPRSSWGRQRSGSLLGRGSQKGKW